MDIEGGIDKWLKKLIWLWLPFYALWHLTQEALEGKKDGGH